MFNINEIRQKEDTESKGEVGHLRILRYEIQGIHRIFILHKVENFTKNVWGRLQPEWTLPWGPEHPKGS